MRKVVQVPVLFLAAKKAGFNELRRTSVYCAFPHLRSRGFFRLGGYSYTYYGGLYSADLQSNIDELIAIHVLSWRVTPESEVYSLTKRGETYVNRVLSEPGVADKILGGKNFEELVKEVRELLHLPYEELEKRTYELLEKSPEVQF